MLYLGIGLPKSVSESLGADLIRQGHKLALVQNKIEVEGQLNQKNLDFCIADLEAKLPFDVLQLISETNATSDEKRAKWIVLASNVEEEFIRDVISLGIHGYVSKRATTEEICERIMRIIKEKENISERRRHVRVQPRKTDDLSFNIPIPNNDGYLQGKIVNISLGGALLEIEKKTFDEFKTISEGLLKTGEHLINVQLAVNKRLLMVDTMVVVVRDNLVGVKFLHPKETFLNSIARYVFNRMIEE